MPLVLRCVPLLLVAALAAPALSAQSKAAAAPANR